MFTFFLHYADRMENDASDSSVVSSVFVAGITVFCLAVA
jgi:hypothetical protein